MVAILGFVFCVVLATVGASHPKGSVHNSYGSYSKQTYHGVYPGKCGNDGFYYNDGGSFIMCSNGNAYVQPCAPGSKNSGQTKYTHGHTYYYHDFCDVNLVDYGYGISHGYGHPGNAGYGHPHGYAAPHGGYTHGHAGYGHAGYGHPHGYGGHSAGYGHPHRGYGHASYGHASHGYGQNSYGHATHGGYGPHGPHGYGAPHGNSYVQHGSAKQHYSKTEYGSYPHGKH